MKCVDCKPGSPCWNHLGKTPHIESPTWQDYLPRDGQGNVILDLPGAVQLALLHSPDFQEELETLYLSGLDVTFERFRFDTQFFGGSSIFYTAAGRDAAGGNSSSILEVQPARTGNRWRAEKLTATGGELVVGLANSLIWQFSGPDDFTSRTLLDFNLVQPLLRAGGRTVVLERLTLAERTLLANVREMERFRGTFYVNVVTGRNTGQGANRRGGVFGGSGLEGFSGVGAGGFGQITTGQGQAAGAQSGVTGGAGAGQAGGYLGLLQNAQVLRNQYATIAGLRDSVEQLQAAYDAGRIDRFQVDLARQALYNAQSQLLNASALYQSQLDNFKTQHGLPPDLPVRVTDPMLDRFSLLDPTLADLQIRVGDMLTALRETGGQAAGAIAPGGLPAAQPLTEFDIEALSEQAGQVLDESRQYYQAAQEDLAQLEEALPQRRATLERLAQREEVETMDIDRELFSFEALNQRVATLDNDLVQLGNQMQGAWARLETATSDATLTPEQRRTELISALTPISGQLLELSLIQARARLDSIAFEPVELTPEEGFCIASHHRLDWMNARASLTDTWRLIAFNAADLQSDLDIVFSGDIGNVGDNPLRLRGSNGRLSVGLEFDAPLTRLAERNTYRQSLIEYQQARRDYYQFRDRIHQGIRQTLRQLRNDELNFELRRAAVHVAISQVDLTRLRLSEPARPAATTTPGQTAQPGGDAQFSSTVARDLVNAQTDLLNVQNDFLSVWVDHEVQRLQLDNDLGIMQLDATGLRIEHRNPLRSYLQDLPNTVPRECPDYCAHLPATSQSRAEEIIPPSESERGLQPSGPALEPLPEMGGAMDSAASAGEF
jgi:hypothetical protein